LGYASLQQCISDLERNGHLVRIKEEVDHNLEMAAIHLRVFEAKGPAILFENVKNSSFPAVSNLFGTIERSRFIFRDTLSAIEKLIKLSGNPALFFSNPFKYFDVALLGLKALPLKSRFGVPALYNETCISELPQIKCWPQDGGAFITLPQVLTFDPDYPQLSKSNLGMYRIQMSGNNYEQNKEVGLHYQIHRGIGVHQTKWNKLNKPMKVSIFVGGPPSHTFSAVMPLPEGMSELMFTGVLGNRNFRYVRKDGYLISSDADFVITGEVYPGQNKPEGPFGDHLGYYSLKHDFPVMKIHKVWHRKNAIWPFTVVGRPPQEDTQFGALIHEITGDILPKEIPGLVEVNAVDAAGVHPLLLAIGSERYTPYYSEKKPQEILTIANHILGTGQMSLAKFLIIAAAENQALSTHNISDFLMYVFERIDTERDVHFYTNTTIDTLDYSGTGLNSGSKVVIAAAGEKRRELCKEMNVDIHFPSEFINPRLIFPGVVAVESAGFDAKTELVHHSSLNSIALVVVCNDSNFTSANLNNFLWVTFTRANPSHDIYGFGSSYENKHWGCKGPLVIDARKKSHHAPELLKDPLIEKKVDRLGEKGGSLYGVI
jgi:4-hydroxy-3-polyprenylbenzoate decarboxylase